MWYLMLKINYEGIKYVSVLTTSETRVTFWPVNSFGSPMAVAVVHSKALVQFAGLINSMIQEHER